MANVYKNIEKLLQEKNISGAKMCSDLGLSRSFVTELKKGRAKSIKIDTAQKIASYFGVSVAVLLEEAKEVPVCTLYERIQFLCRNKGVSASRMCLDLGLSKSTMSDMKSGRKNGVSTATAQKIASYFGVSVGYLLGEEETPIQPKQDRGLDLSNATPLQQMIIESVLNMPVEKQKALAQILGLEV